MGAVISKPKGDMGSFVVMAMTDRPDLEADQTQEN